MKSKYQENELEQFKKDVKDIIDDQYLHGLAEKASKNLENRATNKIGYIFNYSFPTHTFSKFQDIQPDIITDVQVEDEPSRLEIKYPQSIEKFVQGKFSQQMKIFLEKRCTVTWKNLITDEQKKTEEKISYHYYKYCSKVNPYRNPIYYELEGSSNYSVLEHKRMSPKDIKRMYEKYRDYKATFRTFEQMVKGVEKADQMEICHYDNIQKMKKIYS